MSAAPPKVLLYHPMLARFEPALAAEGWGVAKAWDLDDGDRAAVRAMAHAGDIPLPREFLQSLPNLGLIACVGAGYDGVDVAWCRARGIEVTNAAGLNADDVADQAIGLMIAGWRGIVAGDRAIREGLWRENHRNPASSSLTGRRFGVVGLGAIGEASAHRARAFGLEVAWWGPRPKPAPWPRRESLLDLAAWSDILLVASRANADNRGLISREVIEAVGPDGMIVNVARGSLIDEDALIAALKAGDLGHAGLDVFAEEPTPAQRWADVPNVVLTPHIGSTTHETVPRLVARTIENLRLFFSGRPVAHPVPAET
ncbi:2-hydroxyacid dehydrogenase [Phenylobacterium sp. LjRoot225]|uniref:2-hydroxyacid dehydrogenase n=1 Tax=Phenylobacterium sp. LjRoot225 TaxID=3342285 RepID=UPI003ECEFD8C